MLPSCKLGNVSLAFKTPRSRSSKSSTMTPTQVKVIAPTIQKLTLLLSHLEELSILPIGKQVELQKYFLDFDIIKTNYDCAGCKVHKGFHDVYEDLANNLFACAYTLTSNHPDAKLLITGHSLGAAIGSFAALEIQKYVHNVDIFYNFGQPRVGNAAFKDHIESQLSHLFIARVTHYKDIFVHLPTQDMGFTHYGNEVYLN